MELIAKLRKTRRKGWLGNRCVTDVAVLVKLYCLGVDGNCTLD